MMGDDGWKVLMAIVIGFFFYRSVCGLEMGRNNYLDC